MAERRMISKSIGTSRKVNRLSDRAALLYTWMIPHTDDYGRLEGDSISIKAKVVPMRATTHEEVEQDVKELINIGLLTPYEWEGEKYVEIVGFENFQTFKNDRPKRQAHPGPKGWIPVDSSGFQRVPLSDVREEKLREVKLSKVKRSEVKSTTRTGSIDYLKAIPEDDLKEFTERFVATEKQIRSKAEDLRLYCDRKGKVYKDYRAFLLNALKRDFPEKEEAQTKGKFAGIKSTVAESN